MGRCRGGCRKQAEGAGRGQRGPQGAARPGDLYVFISVKAHPAGLRREGTTIHSEVEISFVDAILGTTAKVSPLTPRAIHLLVALSTAALLQAWDSMCAAWQ